MQVIRMCDVGLWQSHSRARPPQAHLLNGKQRLCLDNNSQSVSHPSSPILNSQIRPSLFLAHTQSDTMVPFGDRVQRTRPYRQDNTIRKSCHFSLMASKWAFLCQTIKMIGTVLSWTVTILSQAPLITTTLRLYSGKGLSNKRIRTKGP